MRDPLPQNSFAPLESFSGPLDLLLQLVRNQEMDIFQIDIYQITSQYMEYLKKAPQTDLEKAGDFIRTAGILLYIKSKSLLPQEEPESERESPQTKESLSEMLLAYQKFQKAGDLLYNRSLLGKDCWNSPRTLAFKNPKDGKIQIDRERGQLQLIQAYQKNLINKKIKESYKIKKPIPTLLHRLRQIAELFIIGSKFKFHQLPLIHKEPHNRLLSFLSLLELSKKGVISLLQKKLFSSIEIFVNKTLTKEVMEDFSSQGEKKASQEPEEESFV